MAAAVLGSPIFVLLGGVAMLVFLVDGGKPAVQQGLATGVSRSRFTAAEAGAALWNAKWEVLLPVVVLASVLTLGLLQLMGSA